MGCSIGAGCALDEDAVERGTNEVEAGCDALSHSEICPWVRAGTAWAFSSDAAESGVVMVGDVVAEVVVG